MKKLLAALLLLLALPAQAATTLYFSKINTWVSPVTPAFDAGWEVSSIAQRHYLSDSLIGTADWWQGTGWCCSSSPRITMTVSSTNQELLTQHISPPMPAGIVFAAGLTLFSMQAVFSEQASTDNINQCILGIRILDDDNTTINATLAGVANYGTTTELQVQGFGGVMTQGRNKTCANSDAVTANYETALGDRLIVEVGLATTGATDADPQGYWIPADNGNSQTDGTAKSLCAANETTTQCTAHIDFSNTITFLAEPNPGPTRFYLPTAQTTTVTPAFSAIVGVGSPATNFWEATTLAVRRHLSHAKGGSTTAEATGISINDTGGGATSEILRQYVSAPMAAGVVFTAMRTHISGQIRARMLLDLKDDLIPIAGVRIYSQDGTTLRATILPVDFYWQNAFNGTAPLATTATNEQVFSNNNNTYSMENYTTVSGDRLVYELGVYQRDISQSTTVTVTYGETAADCPESDHVFTTSCSPWIEFSNAISFLPETPRRVMIN